LRNVYHGFGGEVRLELGTDYTAVTMRPADLAPNAAIVRPILLNLSLVNVSQLLPQVPGNLLLGVHPLDLNQRCVWVLVRLGPVGIQITQVIIHPSDETKQHPVHQEGGKEALTYMDQ